MNLTGSFNAKVEGTTLVWDKKEKEMVAKRDWIPTNSTVSIPQPESRTKSVSTKKRYDPNLANKLYNEAKIKEKKLKDLDEKYRDKDLTFRPNALSKDRRNRFEMNRSSNTNDIYENLYRADNKKVQEE